jgi:hypothetical protein
MLDNRDAPLPGACESPSASSAASICAAVAASNLTTVPAYMRLDASGPYEIA